ncbi:hypothetical protein [Celerinatantimonas sp. YJH-8]|uniref:hypothetical protein n=1 Tax=Celerinatantimonas sp. YJH-8 TaxID=3228714 RepID=UPI0038C6BC05
MANLTIEISGANARLLIKHVREEMQRTEWCIRDMSRTRTALEVSFWEHDLQQWKDIESKLFTYARTHQ